MVNFALAQILHSFVSVLVGLPTLTYESIIMNEPPDTRFKLPACLIEPTKSVEKLCQLNFDPIQRMVQTYDRIDRELDSMLYDEDGEPKRRFSQVAYASLLGIQQKIANDLIRYGYQRVSEGTEQLVTASMPINITLTRDTPSTRTIH